MNTTAQNGTTHLALPDRDPATALARATGGTINAFGSAEAFETSQRMAKALSSSTMVPKQYQGQIANCMIAIELAARIGCSVFMVCQNLDIIHGRPGWRGAFLIATVNASGRFTPLRFRWVGEKGADSFGCLAVAKDKETGEELVGATIDWKMVKAEGWLNKDGSKWKTMPEQMFMYRAGAFWTRVYNPEGALGMGTSEELEDMRLPPIPFSGSVEVVPDAPPSAPAGAVDAFLARIAEATTVDALKVISKEMGKLPADVGAACSDAYAARRAELAKPQAVRADPETGELTSVPPREPGED